MPTMLKGLPGLKPPAAPPSPMAAPPPGPAMGQPSPDIAADRQRLLRAMMARARGGDQLSPEGSAGAPAAPPAAPIPPVGTGAPVTGSAASEAMLAPIRELLGRFNPQFSGLFDQALQADAGTRDRLMQALAARGYSAGTLPTIPETFK